jgi:hypothetical protein
LAPAAPSDMPPASRRCAVQGAPQPDDEAAEAVEALARERFEVDHSRRIPAIGSEKPAIEGSATDGTGTVDPVPK